jgi:hypothetical protein
VVRPRQVTAARADRRPHGSTALGDHPPCARLVLRHSVAGRSSLRITDDGNRGTTELGCRGDVVLLGAQVISEYESVGRANQDAPPKPLRTD